MSVRRALSASRREYTVSYPSPTGVDFSMSGIGSVRSRFAHIENMYRDYESSGGYIESVPGFRKILSLGKRINGMYLQKAGGEEYIIIHAKDELYRFNVRERDSLDGACEPLATVCDRKSTAFAVGECVYILDGEKLTRVTPEGGADEVGELTEAPPYIPTCYLNGHEYEQRNLLSDYICEESFITFPEDAAYASPELIYKITDPENKKCKVMGVNESFSGELSIPSYMTLDGERYEVTEIYDFAFSRNTAITSVRISEGLKRMGIFAFSYCTALERAVLPDSLEVIDNDAFTGCTSLSRLRIGSALSSFGSNVFANCPALLEVEYALDAPAFWNIDSTTALPEFTVTPNVQITDFTVSIKLVSRAEAVLDVKLNGVSQRFTEMGDGMAFSSVVLSNVSRESLTGATVKILLVEKPHSYGLSNISSASFLERIEADAKPSSAIMKCTVAECFDGRVFLSGNPDFPNTVFYSGKDLSGSNNPLYFGALNYFDDGIGHFPVKAMLAAGDSLAVFKEGDDGTGSIFYHTPKSTDINLLPKIYPTSYVHSGVCARGGVISFFDDPLFLSEIGVLSLDKQKINLERSISCRSHSINSRLLSEELENASLALWCGYLFLTVGGRAYLADSRAVYRHASGALEYEWFYLDGIGTYSDDRAVYRYSQTAHYGYKVKTEAVDSACEATVYSAYPGIDTVYYSLESGSKYELYKTSERTGGSFSPAVKLLSTDGRLLFFGTESGDVCVFNNDKRGTAPPAVRESADFDEELYQRAWGRRIHPSYYSFDSHRVSYRLRTVYDDGGIPYLTKSSIKSSLTVKLEAINGGELICRAESDTGAYEELCRLPSGALDFSELDFSSLSFTSEGRASIPIREKLRGWVDKRIEISSYGFCTPFALSSLSYRFTVKGKIKKPY